MRGWRAAFAPPTSGRSMSRLPLLLAFMIAATVGAGILGARWAVRGNADPFDVSWPLYLQIGSLGATILVGLLSRRPFAAAFGVYFGLVTYMLADGGAEYPVASMIALLVHGLSPALAGALCLVLIGQVAAARQKRGRH
jgi:hypothetical protein